MRIAIPVWNGRVSPVFDVARSIRVIDINGGSVTREANHTFENEAHAPELVKLGVDLLICAAISTSLAATLWVSGIEVVSDTCGTVEEIVGAFGSGDRELAGFRSPGNNSGSRSRSTTPSRHRSNPRVTR